MVEKSGVERSGVEAWGWKVRGWDVFQLRLFHKKISQQDFIKRTLVFTQQNWCWHIKIDFWKVLNKGSWFGQSSFHNRKVLKGNFLSYIFFCFGFLLCFPTFFRSDWVDSVHSRQLLLVLLNWIRNLKQAVLNITGSTRITLILGNWKYVPC